MIAFLFPGQGSQYVGMNSFLKTLPLCQDIFKRVDNALHERLEDSLKDSLSDLMENGPEEKLRETQNAQPALMSVSCAVFSFLASGIPSLREKISYVAGHSLGEYSALCAMGSLALEEAARILRIRGRSMQAAAGDKPGSMIALLGGDMVQCEKLLADILHEEEEGEFCEIANDNAPGQIIISGSLSSLERATQKARDYGFKRVIPLNVSAPFHSSQMKSAREPLKEAMEKAPFKDCAIPLVSNVTAKPVQNATTIKGLLVEQLNARVRWRESVEWMLENGTHNFVECGSGKVLSGLVKKIAQNKGREVTLFSTDTRENLEETRKFLTGI